MPISSTSSKWATFMPIRSRRRSSRCKR
jgi:hypothetical protein